MLRSKSKSKGGRPQGEKRTAVREALAAAEMTARDISHGLGLSKSDTKSSLQRLKESGEIEIRRRISIEECPKPVAVYGIASGWSK